MNRLIIGIGPDIDRSGIAILGERLELKNLSFVQIIELFTTHQTAIKNVVIEAGWLNKKSNLHIHAGQSKRVGERIAKNVGENHATGKLLVQIAKSLNLNVIEVRPTRSKKNKEEFNRITGWVGNTNQEQRDAAMLIFGMK